MTAARPVSDRIIGAYKRSSQPPTLGLDVGSNVDRRSNGRRFDLHATSFIRLSNDRVLL
jgi:hypothetical protein